MGNFQMKHSEEEVVKERHKFMWVPLPQKRQHYNDPNYITLHTILPWPQYYRDAIPQKDKCEKRLYRINPEINNRMSVWRGDITVLELDAIVNSVSNPEKCGQVNQVIMEKAGEFFIDECIMNGIPEPGEVMVTSGYKLPAKHIVNALAPKKQDSDLLQDCYRNSLNAARENNIRTIAFPCIATRKKNAFPSDTAARIALNCVRIWLENDINRNSVDRVVFCLYKPEDLGIYCKLMQEYFPIDSAVNQADADGATAPSAPYGI